MSAASPRSGADDRERLPGGVALQDAEGVVAAVARGLSSWAKSRVRASWSMRLFAIVQGALLAARSPLLLSRCRLVRPLLAWTGLTPQSAAKAASLWSSFRVSTCCDEQLGSTVDPDPGALDQFGRGSADLGADHGVEQSAPATRWIRLRNSARSSPYVGPPAAA